MEVAVYGVFWVFGVRKRGGRFPCGYMEGTWGALDDYPIPTKEYD